MSKAPNRPEPGLYLMAASHFNMMTGKQMVMLMKQDKLSFMDMETEFLKLLTSFTATHQEPQLLELQKN